MKAVVRAFILSELTESLDTENDADEFRFNDKSTHEDHLSQNGILTFFRLKMAI